MNSNYLDGFKCPVPTNFSDVLSRCRFEQGDTFHNHNDAYEKPWGEALENLEWSIQVIVPEKSVGESNTHGSDISFLKNWQTSIEVEMIFHKTNQKKTLKSFQGNLYDVLVSGSVDSLFELAPTPKPVGCDSFNNALQSLAIPIRHECQFRMVYNEPYPILRAKRNKLEKEFASDTSLKIIPITEFEISKEKKIMPTCSVCIFDFKVAKDEVEERIKKALYIAVRNKKTNKSTYRTADHGVLV